MCFENMELYHELLEKKARRLEKPRPMVERLPERKTEPLPEEAKPILVEAKA